MKNIWIILFVVVFGCNNSNNDKSINLSEMEDFSIETISKNDLFEKSNYNQLDIIGEKLQETYDLIYLLEKNSDFESAKTSSKLINSHLILDSLDNENSPSIHNLNQIGALETINDSIDYINFSYTLRQGNSEKLDTLKAIIKTKAISIEGVVRSSIKIDFTKYSD